MRALYVSDPKRSKDSTEQHRWPCVLGHAKLAPLIPRTTVPGEHTAVLAPPQRYVMYVGAARVPSKQRAEWNFPERGRVSSKRDTTSRKVILGHLRVTKDALSLGQWTERGSGASPLAGLVTRQAPIINSHPHRVLESTSEPPRPAPKLQRPAHHTAHRPCAHVVRREEGIGIFIDIPGAF